jgi:hypothetical protein
MAAFTGSPASSSQYAQYASHEMVASKDWGAKLRCWAFSYTHASGAGTGEVNLVRMEPGKRRILCDLCRILSSQFAANADLHLGYRAYTKHDGTEVVADDNAFLDNADAGGGVLDSAWLLPAAKYFDIDSKTNFVIYAMVDTGNIEDNDTISGWVVAMEGN